MRAWLLVALAGCRIGGGEGPDDTGEADTLVDDTEVVDTDPADSDVVCLEPLGGGSMPSTWSDVVALGDTRCLRTWSCPGQELVGVAEGECEGSRWAWYGGGARKVAELMYDDTTTCAEDTYEVWYGRVVTGCNMPADAVESAGCARADEVGAAGACALTWPPTSGLRASTWTEAEGTLVTRCAGVATCVLGERTLKLVATHDWLCDAGTLVEVWDASTGALVASLARDFAPGCAWAWSGESLDACLPATFGPTEACGVVALP